MENYSLVLFMASLVIAVAVPIKSDRLLCHTDNGTHTSGSTHADNGQRFDGVVPAVIVTADGTAGVTTATGTVTTAVTDADRSLHRSGDATADQMPRDHPFAQSLDHLDKDESHWRPTTGGHKHQTLGPVQH